MNFRPITTEDVQPFHLLVKLNKKDLLDYFPKTVAAADSPEEAKRLVDGYIEKATTKETFAFVAEDKPNGTMLGIFFLKEIVPYHSKCEIAYFIDKAQQGKGYATEGIKKLIEFGFDQLHLNKIYCRIAIDNYASIRVAEKNNFKPEGSLQKEFKMSSGKFVDVYYMGLLNPASK